MSKKKVVGKSLVRYLALAVLALSATLSVRADIGDEVEFSGHDGLTIYAYWSEAAQTEAGAKMPTVLLFHMAGASARGEYEETVPTLNVAGYHTLAVDLRSGGDRLGAPNKTAARLADTSIGYCDVYPDLEAALNWATQQPAVGPIVAVGSSFSAGLVVQLAANRGDMLAGAVAFSPASGEPMAACRPENYLAQVEIPLIAFRPDREMAIESVQAQAKAFAEQSVQYIEIAGGRHGSLMLRESQTGREMAHAWRPLLAFMEGAAKTKGEVVKIAVDGWELKGELIVPDRSERVPAVLLLHGAAKTRARHAGLARELAARGIASLRLDLRAHGESTNKGTFRQPWADHRYLLDGTERDIVAALELLVADPRIDRDRIGTVSASYSGEFAAKALTVSAAGKAHVSLAPGSFSDESILAIDPSGEPWFFVRAEEEFDFFDDIFGFIAENSGAETLTLPGDAHADALLEAHPSLVRMLGSWFVSKL